MIYGYARVSSVEQNLARQFDALAAAGVERGCIFADKKSGQDFNRPAWKRLKRKLRQGDLLVVQSIDRLGRNYAEILDEWRYIVRTKKSDIRVIDMPLLDTANNAQGLIGKFVSDVVLQLLSFVAETERKNIHERQRQGIASAKARGVKFGRPRIEETGDMASCIEAVRNGSLSLRAAAERCGLSVATIRRRASEFAATSEMHL